MNAGKLRVLCGVDFDRAGEGALDQAIALARATRAPLCVLHAVPAAAPFAFAEDDHLAHLARYREKALAARVAVGLRAEHADPADALARVASNDRYNLVVIGRSAGRAGSRLSSLPDIVSAVAGRGLAPVLIVPEAAGLARRMRSGFRSVVWAVARTPIDVEAEDAVLRLTRPDRLDLTLVTVVRRGESSRETGMRRLALALSDEIRGAVRPRLCVSYGQVPQSIVRVASRGEADLIVAGVGSPAASTAASIVEAARVPVLVLPAAGAGREVPIERKLARAA